MSHSGWRASVRCPPLRITKTRMSLPCCVRICTEPGATSEATLRVILGKTRRERPAGDGGALRSEG